MIGQHEFKQWKRRTGITLSEITIPWEIHLQEDKIFKDKNGNGRLYLQIQFDEVDNVTGAEDYRAYCRKFYLSPHMTDEEVIRTFALAVKTFEEHEANEWLKFDGYRVLNPHPEGPRP